MVKLDFPPLLHPGMHKVSMQGLHALAVAPFARSQRRRDLYQKLAAWVGALKAVGVGGTLWLDGSFLTEKPAPGDIDCVLWNPHWADGGANVTSAMRQQTTHLLDRAEAENQFDLDLYIEMPASDMIFHREAYWRGVLGFSHDRITAKGFAEVNL
jgi:hypothetical protein